MGRRIVAIGAAAAGTVVAAVLAGCTSDNGALPPPTASPTSEPATTEPTTAGRAETALLGPDDVPDGFAEAEDVDTAGRWDELLNESEQSVSVRPDCSAPLEAVSGRLASAPPDSAGVVFDDDDGGEILQFTAVLDEALGTTIVTELADLHARCDGYTLPVPESGSLSISISPLDLDVAAAGESTVTVWERTLISSTLRQREIRAAYSAGDISGFIRIAGEPDLSDAAVTDLISAAVHDAEEVGR